MSVGVSKNAFIIVVVLGQERRNEARAPRQNLRLPRAFARIKSCAKSCAMQGMSCLSTRESDVVSRSQLPEIVLISFTFRGNGMRHDQTKPN